MAELLVKAGNNVTVWNRTAAKAEPLAKLGAKVVKSAADLSGLDIVFSIVSTGKDLEEVYFGTGGVTSGKAKLPPSSSIAPPSASRNRRSCASASPRRAPSTSRRP
jgi:3-hydroxyisobutyrate dehydrogenase-like beta-hydroxyacid dehydrogenase